MTARAMLLAASGVLLGVAMPAQVAPHAPDGRTRERIDSVSILPKPGAPFSAVVVTEWTRLLEDGTRTTIRNHRTVARDSSGRIFEERRAFSPDGDRQETRLMALQYSDPTRHEFVECLPATKVCTMWPWHAPATVPKEATSATILPNGTVTREDLGERRIAGLDAVGSREIMTVQGGVGGYKTPEPTVKEFWYSPHLEVNLVVKRFDPRGGAQNFALEQVNLAEPDPKLFSPPADYKRAHTVTE